MLSPKCTPSDYPSIIYLDFLKLIDILRQSKYFLNKQSFLRLSDYIRYLQTIRVSNLAPPPHRCLPRPCPAWAWGKTQCHIWFVWKRLWMVVFKCWLIEHIKRTQLNPEWQYPWKYPWQYPWKCLKDHQYRVHLMMTMITTMIMTIPLTRFMPQFLSPMLRASALSLSAPSPTSFTLLESWYALLNVVNLCTLEHISWWTWDTVSLVESWYAWSISGRDSLPGQFSQYGGYILKDLRHSFVPRLLFTSSHLLPSLPLCSDLEQGFPSCSCNPSFGKCCLNIMLPPTRVAKRLSTIFLGAPATCECAPGGEELQLPHSCPKVSDPPATQELTATTLHPFKAMIPGPRYHPRPVFTSCNRLHYNLPAIDFITIFRE